MQMSSASEVVGEANVRGMFKASEPRQANFDIGETNVLSLYIEILHKGCVP